MPIGEDIGNIIEDVIGNIVETIGGGGGGDGGGGGGGTSPCAQLRQLPPAQRREVIKRLGYDPCSGSGGDGGTTGGSSGGTSSGGSSSGGGSAGPSPDDLLKSNLRSVYFQLWGVYPAESVLSRAVNDGLNVWEFEEEQRKKPAFRRTETYKNEADALVRVMKGWGIA